MLEKSAKVVAAARAKGITVIHAPIMFKEDASDSSACVEYDVASIARGVRNFLPTQTRTSASASSPAAPRTASSPRRRGTPSSARR